MKRTLVLVTSLLTALVFTGVPLSALAQGGQGPLAQGGQGSIYAVQGGDTAYSIAARYCMTSQELISLNGAAMSNPNQLYPGTQIQVINRCGGATGGAWSGGSYSGGGYYGGAGYYGGSYGANCGWGGGVYDRGPRLHAQGYVYGNTYVVARGDTAFSIAQRFGTSTYAIGQANGINPWYIYAGQRLIIPSYGGYGTWCQPPCSGGYYGGHGCPPPNPIPPVYPIPITPVPTAPVVQPAIQITAPAANATLQPTFTVAGSGQGLYAGALVVRAQTSNGTVLIDQPVTLQGPNASSGGAGTFSTSLTVNVPAPTPGFIVVFAPQTPTVAAVSVPVTFSPGGGGPGGAQYTTYTGTQCVVTVISGAPYYPDLGVATNGSFSAVGTYTATRGAKYNNQLWFQIGPVPSSTTPVWTPITGVSSLSPTCYW